MRKKKIKTSIILEVAVLFALGILLTGILTFITQHNASNTDVTEDTEEIASGIAEETARSIREYSAYEWLLQYCYEHKDTMDIEYDAPYSAESETAQKLHAFNLKYPGISLRYAGEAELSVLPEEDRKMAAEILYSWITSRLDVIKQTYGVDYLFVIMSEKPYNRQFFLFSAADQDGIRGTGYEQVYTLGVEADVSESQQEAMRNALESDRYLTDAGSYLDYYESFGEVSGKQVFIGQTYDLSRLKADILEETWSRTAWAALYQVLLSLFCMALLMVFVMQPLKKVQQSIRQYKEFKDSKEVVKTLSEVRFYNEIGQLSEDVSAMTQEIDEYLGRIETITAEKERMAIELDLAARIQANTLPNIFPPFPDRKEFDIYASMDPAKEIGGDFYDFFFIDEDHLAVLIADVSGKGIPAALFMMVSMIMIHNASEKHSSPAEVLAEVNEVICRKNPEEMFLTVWMGILDVNTGVMTAASAGHEYPVLRRNNSNYELFKDKHGFVIGGMEGVRYQDYTVQMEPGDGLFVYTDGVPEATDADNQLFGTDRLLEALNQEPAGDPETILGNVRTAVDAFVQDAEQFDDLTMLCLTYHGRNVQ